MYRRSSLSEYVSFNQAKKYCIHEKLTTYTLRGGEIHGEQVESSFNFVHPCIGKLWSVVEVPVDFIANGLHTN